MDTSYTFLLGAPFVMGLGIDATMMPMMTAAPQTLTHHNLARGTALMNIVQQVAASIGTALFSVLLTNGFKDSPGVGMLQGALASGQGPAALLPRSRPPAAADPSHEPVIHLH